ncbi:McrB family protein [Streptococcus uberis]|uniref:McrB family protein n=1 Tax=Streptococcus uberis TaxID=1349 RepID=UPI0021BC2B7F|nr:AAA family ATPase [Streptococcus uberis]
MDKVVMPKNSALLDEIQAVLKIYYEADDWLSNDIYKDRLKDLIGSEQYASSYTKKSQITSYFGFTEWEDILNAHSKRRITQAGKKMYEALISSNDLAIQEIIMESLENVVFGRNNYGVPSSDTDVEPPSLFIRAILDLGYFTYQEFAYVLWSMVDNGLSYTSSIQDIKVARKSNNLDVPEEAKKYVDCKPIMMLVRWDFLAQSDSQDRGVVVNAQVLSRYEERLRTLAIYNVDKIKSKNIISETVAEEVEKTIDLVHTRVKGGDNLLFYGVPGSGKSHAIDEHYSKEHMVRVVFHPDYMNTDFIGQILPTIREDESITYEFKPGPFTRVLQQAYKDPHNMYYLVIEEINRGNAPAIFGEIFQLLDRIETGESKYSVVNYDVSKVVYGDETTQIKLPSNLTLLATMNTSDQNVFTLDTAFQRRWNMKMILNDISSAEHKDIKIADTSVSWGDFNVVINKCILSSNASMLSSEDKRLGSYFISPYDLKNDTQAESRFSEKVIKYLWDDAFKFSRDKLFDTVNLKSLEDVIIEFTTQKGGQRFNIFREEIKAQLLSGTTSNEDSDTDESHPTDIED